MYCGTFGCSPEVRGETLGGRALPPYTTNKVKDLSAFIPCPCSAVSGGPSSRWLLDPPSTRA